MLKNLSKEQLKEKAKAFLKKWAQFFLNPRLLLCVFIAWMITNGWSYLFAALGAAFGITWMTVAGAAYMSLLWLPFTPEKIITLFIAIGLMKLLFPKDTKTLGVLHDELNTLKAKLRESRDKRREKRAAKRAAKTPVKSGSASRETVK